MDAHTQTHLVRFIAAERPPHLKAIAPWEGLADSYGEMNVRGGIPNPSFVDYRGEGYCGKTDSFWILFHSTTRSTLT